MLIKPPSNRHPFHFPDYIEFALKEYEIKDWTNKTYDNLRDEFRSTFLSIPFFPIVVKKGTILFRGRKPLLFTEGPFGKLSELGIKPREKVNTFGRANTPDQAVFYSSTTPETVVREIAQWYINDAGRAQDLISRNIMQTGFSPVTQLFTLTNWECKEDLVVSSLLFTDKGLQRNPSFHEFDQKRKIVTQDQNENVVKSFNLILDFFCKQFGREDIKDDEEYKFSAYYANEVFDFVDPRIKFDGLIYSSVANNFEGENIVLTEESFKNKVKFKGAQYFYSANLSQNPLRNGLTTVVCPIQNGEYQSDGTFIWTDVPGIDVPKEQEQTKKPEI
jgi:hypothetical protein